MDIAPLRDKLSLSQQEFGQLLGVHSMTVSRWERGVANPPPYQAALISEFAQAAVGDQGKLSAEVKTRLMSRGIASALLYILAASESVSKKRYGSISK